MLKLWLMNYKGEKQYVESPSGYFDYEYEDEWITEDIVKEMIKNVDKSIVEGPRAIMSPVFGMISPRDLSGGVKTLIIAMHDNERVYNLSACGDNCAKWALEIGKNQDLEMRLGYYMHFKDYEPFEIMIMNTNKIIHTWDEFVDEMYYADREERKELGML
jgi:hypothetical protein